MDLLAYLKIIEWDTIIVGDGSGSGWDIGCGWAGVLVDRYSNARKLVFGAADPGTVNIGELLPYVLALDWYTERDGPGRQRLKEATRAGRTMNVHLISDSEIIVKSGNNPDSRRSHRALWAAMDAFSRQGYSLHYHHVGRDIINLNILVDQVSRRARLDLKDVYAHAITDLRKKYPGLPKDVTPYDFSH